MSNDSFYTIGHLQVPQEKILHRPLWYFDVNNKNGIVKIFKELKELTGYRFDNTHLKWSNIYGHLFAISIHHSKNGWWTITMWDHTGKTTVVRFSQKVEDKETDVLSSENYNILREKSIDYVRGLIDCSDCGIKIKQTDVAGSYFAGRYCSGCWEREWKEVEARENYN